MKRSTFFHIALLVILVSGCASTKKIETLKPEPDDATPLIYDNESSFIDLPVTIKLKDIENQINKTLTGLIYEDNTIDDDDYTVKIWKTGNITLRNVSGRIETVLPLKAIVNYRYGLGKILSDTREITMNGVVTVSSSIKMSNWKVNSVTELKSLDWTDSPTVSVAGKNLPITYLINPAIKLFRSKIEKSIDGAIDKSMDFKSNVLDALEKICTPSEMSAEYESWLRIVPVELYATDAVLQKDAVNMEMGLKCYIETLVGKKPEAKFDRNKIALKAVSKMPDKITANIVAVSTFKDASKIMTKNFQGQEFGSGNKKVTVQQVNLWHKDGKMVIALDLLGSVTGTVYLAGFPQYNDATKEIFFDQLDYAIDTKSKLLRAANWLASGYILKKIQETCRYSIKPNLEEGKQNILKYMKNYSPMPGVFVNGSVSEIQFKKMQLTNKAIIAFLALDGKVDIKVDGLK
ncbi:hypothetical protein HYN48_05295 [Flavobacterium magnum]|uniref:DUF4403 domain-containing protein n=1 Tax=Flavobacterium magnum TaxID=2162713 RepID=A0A2S0RE76_9FLAO|nr:DUF4403 family protein [Flavobacterium magnum]AWA29548.1 hypothetical protein HYN48_05295 [Flavobacterium magnum]